MNKDPGSFIRALHVIPFRHQINRDIIKKYRANDSSTSGMDRRNPGHDDENFNSGYQELGRLDPPSPYDSIH